MTFILALGQTQLEGFREKLGEGRAAGLYDDMCIFVSIALPLVTTLLLPLPIAEYQPRGFALKVTAGVLIVAVVFFLLYMWLFNKTGRPSSDIIASLMLLLITLAGAALIRAGVLEGVILILIGVIVLAVKELRAFSRRNRNSQN